MGGGPANADVVRASCILTFPEETEVEPVPVDAWYLHAVGLTFLRRLARDRVGDAPRIALIMQKTDDASEQKRYLSVNSDAILRNALKETFEQPERVLVLHIVALDKVLGQKSIHVTPEINPNVSPEPVAPLGMVFPTLTVEAVQEVPEAMAMSSSFRLSRSVYDPEKPARSSMYAPTEKQLSHSDSILGQSQEFGFTGKRLEDSSPHAVTETPSSSPPTATVVRADQDDDETSFAFSAAGAKLISGDDQDSDIPLARIVGQDTENESPRIPSDYVMLELQNGAGLGDVPTMPATSASTFFISPTWHLHADELSASARLRADEASQQQAVSAARPISEWSSINNSSGSMEDSFVLLERDASPSTAARSRRRFL